MGESISSFKKDELQNIIDHIETVHNVPELERSLKLSDPKTNFCMSSRKSLEFTLRLLMKKYGHHYYEFSNFIKPKTKQNTWQCVVCMGRGKHKRDCPELKLRAIDKDPSIDNHIKHMRMVNSIQNAMMAMERHFTVDEAQTFICNLRKEHVILREI